MPRWNPDPIPADAASEYSLVIHNPNAVLRTEDQLNALAKKHFRVTHVVALGGSLVYTLERKIRSAYTNKPTTVDLEDRAARQA